MRARYALNGIVHTWKTESSFRMQLKAAFGSALIWTAFHASSSWWAALILMISAILSAELINTSLEHLADHLHPEIHPKIGLAKDCAAGAALVLSLAGVALLLLFLSSHISSIGTF